jgi:hypothetical protein
MPIKYGSQRITPQIKNPAAKHPVRGGHPAYPLNVALPTFGQTGLSDRRRHPELVSAADQFQTFTNNPEIMEKPKSEPAATATKAGIGFGCALAIAISWTAHKSFLWVLVHGFFNWFYVIYYLLTADDWTWL